MTKDFKDSLAKNINPKDVMKKDEVASKEEVVSSAKFTIKKKGQDKTNKKSFPLYMDYEKAKKLDKLSKKLGYSRNELICMMIDYCTENIEIE